MSIHIDISVFFELKNSTLNVQGKNISDEGISLICSYLDEHPEIHTLNLSKNKITAAGLKELATNTTLKRLDLSSNEIGDDGVATLAKMPLTALNVSDCGIGPKGAQELLGTNKTINELNLSNNSIDKDGVQAVKANKTITILNVSGNFLDDEDAKNISQNKVLKTLEARSNRIGNIGVQALIETPNLTVIDLGDNLVNEEGAKNIQKILNPKTKPLQLELEFNDISEKLKDEVDNTIKEHNRLFKITSSFKSGFWSKSYNEDKPDENKDTKLVHTKFI